MFVQKIDAGRELFVKGETPLKRKASRHFIKINVEYWLKKIDSPRKKSKYMNQIIFSCTNRVTTWTWFCKCFECYFENYEWISSSVKNRCQSLSIIYLTNEFRSGSSFSRPEPEPSCNKLKLFSKERESIYLQPHMQHIYCSFLTELADFIGTHTL